MSNLFSIPMRRMAVVATAIISAPLFTACTSEYLIREFMNGPQACNAKDQNEAMVNVYTLDSLPVGVDRNYAMYSHRNVPDETKHYKTLDGHVVIADYYVTEAKAPCPDTSADYAYLEPAVYENNKLVGVGNVFFDKYKQYNSVVEQQVAEFVDYVAY